MAETGPEGGSAPRPRDTVVDPHRPCHVVYEGYTVLVTQPNGELDAGALQGLLDFDTRILSRHRLTVGGRVPEGGWASVLAASSWVTWLRIPLGGGAPAGPRLPQDLLLIVIERWVGRGMRERITVRNHSMAPVETELGLEVAADFVDVQELGRPRQFEGQVSSSWDERARSLCSRTRRRAPIARSAAPCASSSATAPPAACAPGKGPCASRWRFRLAASGRSSSSFTPRWTAPGANR